MYNKRIIISENEKNNILSLYGYNTHKRDYIFELCTSIDGRYFILKDEVFDNKTKTDLGNLWESIDIFKTIFKNVKIENPEYQTIKESILSIPLLESENNLKHIKNFLLEWSFWDDTWLGSNITKDVKSTKDAFVQGWEGLKKFGVNIGQNDWKDILTQLMRGVKFIVRSLKNALYSNTGMIVDGILVATGIGKGAQMVAWGLVVALDIYQLATNDYPEEEASDAWWIKVSSLCIDLLGLTTTGAFAKSLKKLIEPLKRLNIIEASNYISKTPKLKNIFTSISSKLRTIPSLLNKIKTVLANKFPKGVNFIDDAITKFNEIFGSLDTTLNKLLGKKTNKIKTGLKSGVATAGVNYGIEKGVEMVSNDPYKQDVKLTPEEEKKMLIIKTYMNKYKNLMKIDNEK